MAAVLHRHIWQRPIRLPLHSTYLARRWKVSHKNRHNLIRKRATEQHVDYLRQLEGPPEYRRPYRPVDVDPKLRTHVEDAQIEWGSRTRHGENMPYSEPFLTRQPLPEEGTQLKSLEEALNPKYEGVVGNVDFGPFGSVEVQHGDAFQIQAQTLIVPMVPNFLPYRGFGLEVLDRGGQELVWHAFEAVRQHKDIQDFLNDEEVDSGYLETHGVPVGTVVPVELQSNFAKADIALFAIMPWYWQGGPSDATRRFRFCISRALGNEGAQRFSSVVMPHLGCGLYGYEPKSSAKILVDEAIEALLHLNEENPRYELQKIIFADRRKSTALLLAEALQDAAHRWVPGRRLTSAPQYWSAATQRLVVLPERPSRFLRHRKVTFKMYHGVIRNARRNYLGNIRPFLWRAHRVERPPPLQVYKESGEPAEVHLQHKANPYYFRGVTHMLFPNRRSGFHVLRRSARGQWLGLARQYRLREDTRPRM